jgi:hypothetical protein
MSTDSVDYGLVWKKLWALLRTAFSRLEDKSYLDFKPFWLENYTLYMAIKYRFNGIAWYEWPDEALRSHDADALRRAKKELSEDIAFYGFVQWLFNEQWTKLKEYAAERGISIIGDMPIYVSGDSAEVWSRRNLFNADADGHFLAVGGVPPDYFNPEEMINFIRPLLSSALKDNTSLQFAVITGCLRVSKESIFTGLNNPTMISVLNREYSEYFGFTQSEIDAMLKHYGLEEKRQLLRDWYNGYLFGNTEVYNPFSSVLVVGSWLVYAEEFPKPYWVNTSGNDIVRKLIDVADNETRSELEVLMAGGTITKPVHEDITYEDIYKNSDNLWNFMFFTGYLKKVAELVDDKGRIVVEMKIPNKELDIIFYNKVQEWFREQVKQRDLSKLYEAILSGNAPVLQEELGDFMLDTISYMDGKEDFYHGVMLGILSGMQKYSVKSNRETGLGRCDIVMTHRSGRGKAIIFELKWTTEMGEIQKKRDEALKQIIDGKYSKELESKCYTDIIKYGIAFCQKSCEVGTLD